mmetsp:Transcript_22086/g.53919  ORF Transcript_22086/g.53919 Transcript_22086/m.53919 type:complete len:378 (+) Transcript_22086:233-1366(+)
MSRRMGLYASSALLTAGRPWTSRRGTRWCKLPRGRSLRQSFVRVKCTGLAGCEGGQGGGASEIELGSWRPYFHLEARIHAADRTLSDLKNRSNATSVFRSSPSSFPSSGIARNLSAPTVFFIPSKLDRCRKSKLRRPDDLGDDVSTLRLRSSKLRRPDTSLTSLAALRVRRGATRGIALLKNIASSELGPVLDDTSAPALASSSSTPPASPREVWSRHLRLVPRAGWNCSDQRRTDCITSTTSSSSSPIDLRELCLGEVVALRSRHRRLVGACSVRISWLVICTTDSNCVVLQGDSRKNSSTDSPVDASMGRGILARALDGRLGLSTGSQPTCPSCPAPLKDAKPATLSRGRTHGRPRSRGRDWRWKTRLAASGFEV